jgi:hypothetical protein
LRKEVLGKTLKLVVKKSSSVRLLLVKTAIILLTAEARLVIA